MHPRYIQLSDVPIHSRYLTTSIPHTLYPRYHAFQVSCTMHSRYHAPSLPCTMHSRYRQLPEVTIYMHSRYHAPCIPVIVYFQNLPFRIRSHIQITESFNYRKDSTNLTKKRAKLAGRVAKTVTVFRPCYQ